MKKRIVILAVLLILCELLPNNIVAKSKNMEWIKVTNESECNNYHDIAFNKDKVYIVVGDDGSIVRSEDTKTWEKISSKTVNNLLTVATNGKNFVAGGNNGALLYSSNGKAWSKCSINFNKKYDYKMISDCTKEARANMARSWKINWSKKIKIEQLKLKSIIWDEKNILQLQIGRW